MSAARATGPAPATSQVRAARAAGPVVDEAGARPRRSSGALEWPAVVALTSVLVFAGLVASGLFDAMIEAL